MTDIATILAAMDAATDARADNVQQELWNLVHCGVIHWREYGALLIWNLACLAAEEVGTDPVTFLDG